MLAQPSAGSDLCSSQAFVSGPVLVAGNPPASPTDATDVETEVPTEIGEAEVGVEVVAEMGVETELEKEVAEVME